MKTIYKYPIPFPTSGFTVEMPDGASVVHVGEQHGSPCFWALVDTNSRSRLRGFVVHGTGHPISDGETHCGSWLQDGGTFVWHLFEVR